MEPDENIIETHQCHILGESPEFGVPIFKVTCPECHWEVEGISPTCNCGRDWSLSCVASGRKRQRSQK